MSHIKLILRIWLAVVATLQLAGCSKTVQWEEEVPLNTGDTIWVTRRVTYSLKGGAGNPFDMAYRPDWAEAISFEWSGKKYRYVGDAQVLLLAISPQTKQPVLIAMAANKSWNWKNNYRCTTPFYVQFVPKANGRDWSWPPSIEPWLMNLPYNLMIHREKKQEVKPRYAASDREKLDRTVAIQSPYLIRIDPNFKTDSCLK